MAEPRRAAALQGAATASLHILHHTLTMFPPCARHILHHVSTMPHHERRPHRPAVTGRKPAHLPLQDGTSPDRPRDIPETADDAPRWRRSAPMSGCRADGGGAQGGRSDRKLIKNMLGTHSVVSSPDVVLSRKSSVKRSTLIATLANRRITPIRPAGFARLGRFLHKHPAPARRCDGALDDLA